MKQGLCTIGILLLAGCGMPEQGEMKLHYDQPAEFFEVARVEYLRDGKSFETEYFASAPDSVIVVRFKSAEPIDAELVLDYPHPHEAVF